MINQSIFITMLIPTKSIYNKITAMSIIFNHNLLFDI